MASENHNLTVDYRPDGPSSSDSAMTLPSTLAGVPAAAVDTIKNYEIVQELGRGGMGVVYLARQKGLERLVALKMVLAGKHAGSAERDRFSAEVTAIARLQHPNIVQVYESGVHEGRAYYSMEYIAGGTLEKKIQGKLLPTKDAGALVEVLARAVAYAHRQGIVHRDLKPANILLQPSEAQSTIFPGKTMNTGNTSTVTRTERAKASNASTAALEMIPKITDFGLAKHYLEEEGEKDSGKTQAGSVLGSPSYMAPEQAMGQQEQVGPGVDIYALGAILYELLCSRPPFRAATAWDTISQVIREEPVPPRRLQPRIPRDLETICLKCLQKDPKRRYETAESLADDLYRYLEGQPIYARPVPIWERCYKAAKRRPAVAATLGILAAGLVFLFWFISRSNFQLTYERDEATKAQQAASKAQKEADAQRMQAHRNLEKAINAMESLIAHTNSDEWTRNDAMQSQRMEILKEAANFYASFGEESSQDPLIQREMARAKFRLGAVYMNMTQYDKAAEALAGARSLQEELVTKHPTTAQYLTDLVKTIQMQANQNATVGRYPKAEASYQEAIQRCEKLCEMDGSDKSRYLLAECYISWSSFNSNKPEIGKDYITKAVKLTEELNSEKEVSYEEMTLLAMAKSAMGGWHLSEGKTKEALETLQSARTVLEKLATLKAPTSRAREAYERCVALTFSSLATAHDRSGNAAEAAKFHSQAKENYEKLLRMNPKSFPSRIMFLRALDNQGQFEATRGFRNDAKKTFDRLQNLEHEVMKDQPGLTWLPASTANSKAMQLLLRVEDGEVNNLEEKIEELVKTRGQTSTVQYNLACTFAQAIRHMKTSEEKEKLAKQAMAMLMKLDGEKYFESDRRKKLLQSDKDLDPLREREDFKKLLGK